MYVLSDRALYIIDKIVAVLGYTFVVLPVILFWVVVIGAMFYFIWGVFALS